MKRTISLVPILLFGVLLTPTARPMRTEASVAMPVAIETSIQLQNGTATFSSTINEATSPDQVADGIFDSPNGWHIARVDAFDGTSSEIAVWETATDLSAGTLVFTMHFLHSNPGHLLGRFRFSVTTDDRSMFADGLDTGGDVDANWVVLDNPSVQGPAGMTFTTLLDNSILAGGTTADQGVYTVTYSTTVSGITGVRLEALEDPTLPGGNGPGLFPRNGNFFLTEMTLDVQTEPECVNAPPGLVSWWPGDGNANDIVGNNHGTLQNGATFAPGMVGQAFSLDGVDDFVRVSSAANLEPQQFTIDAWVFPEGAGNLPDSIGGIIVSKDIGNAQSSPPFISYMLSGPGATGLFRAGIGTTDLTPQPVQGFVGHPTVFSTNTFSFNTWHHVAMTWDGSVLNLYVNGVLEGQLNLGPKTIFYSGDPLSIGRHNGNPFRSYDGLIDEVEFFDRALTAGEIAAIFNAGSAGKCKNRAPMALCQDVTVSADSSCTANASIDNGSFDPDGDSVTLSQSPAGPYPLGSTSVTLTVTDSRGASSQCQATVTVVDDASPTISGASASPSELWPPNHKMRDVTVNYTTADNCGAVSCSLSVTSNEPVNGTGDGNTAPDWEVIDAHHVRLRAERAGTGSGRVYTITITCTDGAGNSSTQTVTVSVPKNKS